MLCLVYVVPKLTSKVEVFKWMLDQEAVPQQVEEWENLIMVSLAGFAGVGEGGVSLYARFG